LIFSHVTTAPGEVTSITEVREYIHSPLALYALLDKDNSLLLESAEIDSKDSVKSLILVDCALKVTCTGKIVTVTAQSNNGMQLLPYLKDTLQNCATTLNQHTLTIEYESTAKDIDEGSKLVADNAFSALRNCINNIKSTTKNPFSLFLGGVFAYDMVANFEQLTAVPDGENSCPVIDHQAKTTELIGNVFNGPDVHANCFEVGKKLERLNKVCDQASNFTAEKTAGHSEVSVDISDEEYCQQVINLKKHIVDGDIFQVVPSRTFSLPCAQPLHAYSQLKQQNPSPYMFYMRDSEFALFGASPESALKFCPISQQVEVYPIAGTRPRGKFANGQINPDLDSRIELELRNDQKERAEHLMLVDLARNDVARISVPGTRHAKELLKVDRYSQVMHLVSRVVGTLKPELDALHAYQACMNMGTLVGAPKVSAAELVRKTEGKRRGSYGGAVGYLTGDGAMDSCIVIRSAFVKNSIAYVQAGAGVVHDSDPQSEANETRAKAQAVITAIQSTYQG